MSVAKTESRRCALIVLGAHRSGTSALAGVLSLLGAQAPRALLPSAKDNPRGFWESAEIVKFHDDILKSSGSRWNDWDAFNPDWLDSAEAVGFSERVAALLEQEYSNARLLLLKDPRICRLLPFWLQALGRLEIIPKFVLPLRHPLEVARSLQQRNGLGRNRALLIWLRHVLEAEHATRSSSRTFVRYEDLLDDWRKQVPRIADQLGVRWPRWSSAVEAQIDDYLSRELRHQVAGDESATGNPELQGWIAEARQALDTLAGSTVPGHGERKVLDRIKQDFDVHCSIFASVVSEHEDKRLAQADRQRRELEDSAQRVAVLTKELEQAKADQAAAELQVGDRESSIRELNADKATLMREAKLSQCGRQSAERTIEQLSAQLAVQDRMLGNTRNLLNERESDLETLSKELSSRSQALLEQSAASDSLRDQLDVRQRELGELQHEGAVQAQLIADREMILADMRGLLDEREVELEQLREDATVQAQRLNEHIAALATSNETQDQAMQRLQVASRALSFGNQEQARSIENRFREIERLTQLLLDTECHAGQKLQAATTQIERLQHRLWAIEHSRSWRSTAPLRGAARIAHRLRHRRSVNDVDIVARSGLFDARWYVHQYPDVASSDLSPVRHYLEFGASEGRNPGPDFYTNRYLAAHPDVAAAGVNPLVHFIRQRDGEANTLDPGHPRYA